MSAVEFDLRTFPEGIELIVKGNCPLGCEVWIACLVCSYGHFLECHYPLRCKEAKCRYSGPCFQISRTERERQDETHRFSTHGQPAAGSAVGSSPEQSHAASAADPSAAAAGDVGRAGPYRAQCRDRRQCNRGLNLGSSPAGEVAPAQASDGEEVAVGPDLQIR